MTSYLIFKYLHYLSIIALVGSVVMQYICLKREVNATDLKKLAISDAVYGISAVLAATFGVTLWLWVGKPAVYYSNNWIFMVKISLYGFIALLSIAPTIWYIKQRRRITPGTNIKVPSYFFWILRMEILLLLLLPLLALLMANGYGVG